MNKSHDLPCGVVIQAAVDWSFLKQRPHHLASEFAQMGIPVLFIENTGTRVPGMRDVSRLWARLRHVLSTTTAAGSGGDSIPEVLSPIALPFPFSLLAHTYNKAYLLRKIRAFLHRHMLESEQVAMITYMSTPVAVDLVMSLPWYATIYDVVSDPKYVEPRVAASEHRLLSDCDLVLFASDALRQSYGLSGNRFRTVRDGFSTWLLDEKGAPTDYLQETPSPRFVYLGGLNSKVWAEALEQIAEAFPDASILLMGPSAPAFRVPRGRNISVLPPQPDYVGLAGVLRLADVALIPYVPSAFVSPMYPAKVNEYLVFGLPIVATNMPELAQLAGEIGPRSIYLAENSGEFPSAVARALNEDSPEERQRRMSYARKRPWTARASGLLRMMTECSSLKASGRKVQ